MDLFVNKLYIWSRSQKNRNLLIQFFFLIFISLFIYYLFTKAILLDMTLSHFDSRAGFGISHTFIIDYTSNDSRWVSYFTGVINTIRVCIVAILFATLLGTIMGVARLSKNILFSTISYLYVEILRNTPLLIQIIFWQIIFLKLPRISEALTFGNTVVISNRGILLPNASSGDNGNIWITIIIIAVILSLIVSYIINKKEDLEGKSIKQFNIKLNGN